MALVIPISLGFHNLIHLDNSKKNDDLSEIFGGNKGLGQSISPKAKTFSEQNQRKHTPGKESQFEGSDSYRPYSSQAYRSPKGSYQKDGLLSSSPYQTYTQSISSYLKSPTRNIYTNGDLSDRLHTNYSEQERSLGYSKSQKYNPMTHLTDAIVRTLEENIPNLTLEIKKFNSKKR